MKGGSCELSQLNLRMKDEKLKNCGCGCGCDCNEHEHEHDHDHECCCGDHEEETFVVDLEDEEGNIVSCEVVDAFEYKEGQYVLIQNPEDESFYLFKSVGEDGELVIPDDEEFEEVSAYYESLLEEEEGEEE